MANTRKATKRAIQNTARAKRNQTVRSAARSALRTAIDAVKAQDTTKAGEAYRNAIRVLSKAASKGGLPKPRAARKISRLTAFFKKTLPAAIGAKPSATPAATATPAKTTAAKLAAAKNAAAAKKTTKSTSARAK